MSVTVTKLGPGSLKFGETASAEEFATHVTKVEIDPAEGDGDKITVLSGDVYVEDGDFEGTISGEFYQEYGLDSLVNWTWTNHGKTMPFTFTPTTDAGLTYTGEVKVKAVKVGGDVGKANTTEFEWSLTKMPEISGA